MQVSFKKKRRGGREEEDKQIATRLIEEISFVSTLANIEGYKFNIWRGLRNGISVITTSIYEIQDWWSLIGEEKGRKGYTAF